MKGRSVSKILYHTVKGGNYTNAQTAGNSSPSTHPLTHPSQGGGNGMDGVPAYEEMLIFIYIASPSPLQPLTTNPYLRP